MHYYLTRLGVKSEVQAFFAPFFYSDDSGDLCFAYSDGVEHFGLAFHRLPVSSACWMAGNTNFVQVSKVVICSSALEAIAWLDHNFHAINDTHGLLFLAFSYISDSNFRWLRETLCSKSIILVLGFDLFGRLLAIKLAAALRGLSLHIVYLTEEKIEILFRGQTFLFSPEKLSLNALERSSGFRFRVVPSVPNGYNSFLEQLQATAGLL